LAERELAFSTDSDCTSQEKAM